MSAEALPTGVVNVSAGRFGFARRHADGVMLPIGFVVICLAGLEILARTLAVPEVLFPSPSRGLRARAVNASTLCYHGALTMRQVVVSLFISLPALIPFPT